MTNTIHAWSRWSAVAALAFVMAMGTTACLQAVDMGGAPKFDTDWRRTLYTHEMFAYEPEDNGQVLFIGSGAHVPAGGMLVSVSRDRKVRALRAHSGEQMWSFQTGSINVAKPLDVGEDIVVASMDGYLYRLHKRNGRQVFKTEFPEGEAMTSAPVVAGGAVIATSIGNRIAAFDARTGTPMWDKKRPHVGEFTITGQAGPTILGKDKVVTGFSDGRLVAYAVEDGATLWSTDLRENQTQFVDVDTTPLVVGAGPKALLVAGCYKVGLFGLDAASGEVKWLARGEGYGSPVAYGKTVYAVQSEGWVSAIDATTGTVQYRHRLEMGSPGQPAVTQKYLLIPNGEGLLMARRSDGRPIQLIRDNRGFSATPEFAYGNLYTISNSGILYALSVY